MNLRRNGLTWYARFTIPKDRWPDFGGKREVVRTLETRDLKEARQRRSGALRAIEAALSADLAERGLPPLSGGWQPPWQDAALAARAELAAAPDRPRYDADGVEYPSERDDKRDHVHAASEAIAAAHGIAASHQYVDVALGTITPIRGAADRWLAAETPRLAGQTVGQYGRALALLAQFLDDEQGQGPAATVLSITGLEYVDRRRAGEFMEWLEQSKDLRRTEGAEALHPRTVERLHSGLNGFWKWCIKRGLVKDNPWTGLSSGLKKKAEKLNRKAGEKRPYEAAELVKLLQADPAAGKRKTWTYGAAIFDAMRLALLTGARANEICSLRRCDVIHDGTGIQIDEAVAKTGNSVRAIPLHPLVQGIIAARVAAVPADAGQDAPLFSELRQGGPDGKRSWHFSMEFTKFRRTVLGADDTVDFHSLRRSFGTFYEHAIAGGVADCTSVVRMDLMGHGRQGVTERHYVNRNLTWPVYTRAVAGVGDVGLPAEVRKALTDTAGNRPSLPAKMLRRPRPTPVAAALTAKASPRPAAARTRPSRPRQVAE